MTEPIEDLAAAGDHLADLVERRAPRTSGHAEAIAELRAASDETSRDAAARTARAGGMSWLAIALVLGVTASECEALYGRSTRPSADDPHGSPGALAP